MHITLSLVSGLATLASATPTLVENRQADCVTGDAVYIISARGTGNAPGEGRLTEVSDLIKSALPGSVSIGLDYPATRNDYPISVNTGVDNLKQAVITYTTNCPDSKIVLLGGSQGAHVVGDVLGGATFSNGAPLDMQYTKNVIAVVGFAPPPHVHGKPYNIGTSTRSGIFERRNTSTLDLYADRYLDICDSDDSACDSGTSQEVHIATIPKYAQTASNYVVARV